MGRSTLIFGLGWESRASSPLPQSDPPATGPRGYIDVGSGGIVAGHGVGWDFVILFDEMEAYVSPRRGHCIGYSDIVQARSTLSFIE